MYKIIALIGEAGSGKDTILRELVKANPSLHEIVSCTTRPMREGEKDGVNYYYYTNNEFAKKVEAKEMFEYTLFNDWFYGTSYDSLEKSKINVGVFNPAGIRSILMNGNDIDLKVYYIQAPAKKRLLRQLNREKDPNVDEIIRRYGTDKADFGAIKFDYYPLRNDVWEDMQGCVNDILSDLEPEQAEGKNS